MRHLRTVRVAKIMFAVATPALLVPMVLAAGPAWAKKNTNPTVTCASLQNGSVLGGTLTGCKDSDGTTAEIGGSSAQTSVTSGKTSQITWANSQTSVETFKFKLQAPTKKNGKVNSKDHCATGLSQVTEKGKITSGSNTALVGQKTLAVTCYNPTSGTVDGLPPGGATSKGPITL
jgi:hypothetical protein